MIHVSPNREDFSSYQKYEQECTIKVFSKNSVKGAGKGDIEVDIECSGKTTRIRLTQVMHVPRKNPFPESPSPKRLQSHILADHICITKDNKTYAEALLGKELHEVRMKVIWSQESILTTVKRDNLATDLHTWHWRLGHLCDSMLKMLAGSNSVKGMEITSSHLTGICRSCIMGNMDEKPF